MRTAVFCFILSGSFAAFPQSLDAQEISGLVLDASSGNPIADASVVLLDNKGKILRGALSDPDGSYTLIAPKPGTCSLRVGGPGFTTWDSPPIELGKGTNVNLDVRLTRLGGSAQLTSFYDRQARLEGLFFTEEEIEARGGSRFSDLMFNLPGVSVIVLPGNRDYRTVRLFGGRQAGGNAGAMQRLEPGSECPPVLFVDGKWWGPIDDAGDNGPDLELLPSMLAGIEIYTPTLVPDELISGRDAELCGVIGVWRKKRS